MKDHQHSSAVYFHAMGLGATNSVTKDNWKMRDADTIMKELGHPKVRVHSSYCTYIVLIAGHM